MKREICVSTFQPHLSNSELRKCWLSNTYYRI